MGDPIDLKKAGTKLKEAIGTVAKTKPRRPRAKKPRRDTTISVPGAPGTATIR